VKWKLRAGVLPATLPHIRFVGESRGLSRRSGFIARVRFIAFFKSRGKLRAAPPPPLASRAAFAVEVAGEPRPEGRTFCGMQNCQVHADFPFDLPIGRMVAGSASVRATRGGWSAGVVQSASRARSAATAVCPSSTALCVRRR